MVRDSQIDLGMYRISGCRISGNTLNYPATSGIRIAYQMTVALDLSYGILMIKECTTYVNQDELQSCFATILVVLFLISLFCEDSYSAIYL